jgi:hypothetical protein
VAVVSAGLQGDPGSCSQAGGSLRRLSSRLESATTRADRATADLRSDDATSGGRERARTRRAARDLARRQRALLDAAHAMSAQLDRAGSALQEHSSDLAEALQELRDLEGRAAAAGLRFVDGRVELRWGVAGVADAGDAAARQGVRDELQTRVDRVLLLLARRRARLAEALESARQALADEAAAVRR